MSLDARPLLLLAAFGTAFFTQLVRQLMKERLPHPRRLVAAALAAGIASLATTSLLLEWSSLSHSALVALSCVVGWSGAPVLGRLGWVLEQHLGTGAKLLEDRKRGG